MQIRIRGLNLVGKVDLQQCLRQKRNCVKFEYEIDLFNVCLKVATVTIGVKNTGEFVNQSIVEKTNRNLLEHKHIYSRESQDIQEHTKK